MEKKCAHPNRWVVIGSVAAGLLVIAAIVVGVVVGLSTSDKPPSGFPVDPPLAACNATLYMVHNTTATSLAAAPGRRRGALSDPLVLGMRVMAIVVTNVEDTPAYTPWWGYDPEVIWVNPACGTLFDFWNGGGCYNATVAAGAPFLNLTQLTDALNAQLNSTAALITGFAGTTFADVLLIMTPTYNDTVPNLQWQGGSMTAPVETANSTLYDYGIKASLPSALEISSGSSVGVVLTYSTNDLIGSSYAELDIGANATSSVIACDTTAAPENATTCVRTPTFTAALLLAAAAA